MFHRSAGGLLGLSPHNQDCIILLPSAPSIGTREKRTRPHCRNIIFIVMRKVLAYYHFTFYQYRHTNKGLLENRAVTPTGDS